MHHSLWNYNIIPVVRRLVITCCWTPTARRFTQKWPKIVTQAQYQRSFVTSVVVRLQSYYRKRRWNVAWNPLPKWQHSRSFSVAEARLHFGSIVTSVARSYKKGNRTVLEAQKSQGFAMPMLLLRFRIFRRSSIRARSRSTFQCSEGVSGGWGWGLGDNNKLRLLQTVY